MKTPLNARIDIELNDILEHAARDTGQNKTEVVEKALNFFFKNCPDIKAYEPQQQEIEQILEAALEGPGIQAAIQEAVKNVLQNSITTSNDVLQNNNTESDGKIKEVRKSGDVFVGKGHIGDKVKIIILKKENR